MYKLYAKIIMFTFISILFTLLLMMFVEAKIVHDFLDDNESIARENEYNLIYATSIANNRNSKDISIFKNPLYYQTLQTQDSHNEINVGIFSIVEFDKINQENQIFIVLDEVRLQNSFTENLDFEEYLIRARITVSNGSEQNDEYMVFDEGFISGYDDSIWLMLIKSSDLSKVYDNGYISKIQVYMTDDQDEVRLFTLSDGNTSTSDDLYNHPNAIRNISLKFLSNDELSFYRSGFDDSKFFYYNSYWKENYKSYNIVYLYYFIPVVCLVSVLAYKIFLPEKFRNSTKYILDLILGRKGEKKNE